MRAMQLKPGPQGLELSPKEMPIPSPGDDEVLVRVYAAGVTPSEVLWSPTTQHKDGSPRVDAVPGHEFSGVIEAVGSGVTTFSTGDEIYGMSDWFAEGATADFCITTPAMIAKKPAYLSHVEAATVPIGALTATQGLLQQAKIQPGERVLIHGGAGAVGMFAVQVAHQRGAHVIATASTRTLEFVKSLGAAQVLDYTHTRFENEVRDIDVVFDTVGGETLDRSWRLLKPGGRLVTIAAEAETTKDQRAKEAFLLVVADAGQLNDIARQLDAGSLKTFVRAVVPFDDAPAAYRGKLSSQLGYGKTAIAVR